MVFVQLANEEMPEVIIADEGNADFAIGMANEKISTAHFLGRFPIAERCFSGSAGDR